MQKETPEQEANRLAKQTNEQAKSGQRIFMNYEDKEQQNRVVEILVRDYNFRLEANIVVTKPPYDEDNQYHI